MPKRFRLISVRLDQDTLYRLEILAGQYPRSRPDRRGPAYNDGPTRSEMIRHAITTGLDVLTHQPPLKL